MDGKSAVVFLPVWKTILPKSGLFVGGGVKRIFVIVGKTQYGTIALSEQIQNI